MVHSTITCPYRLLTKSCSKDKTLTTAPTTLLHLQSDIQLNISRTIEKSMDWSRISEHQTLFLQPKYLKALEDCPPKDMQFAYLTFYKNNQPCGIAYAQIFKFSAYESLKHHRSLNDDNIRFLRLKKWAAHQIKFYSIVCGNVLMTGEYGYHFDNQLVKIEEQFNIVQEGLEVLRLQLKTQNRINANVTLFKDYSANHQQAIDNNHFGSFQIQPNMVIHLDETWKKFDDYLAAISSKYRVRAKSAFKKAKDIEKRELDLEDVERHEARMFDLYLQIVVSAGFNGVTLLQNYFTNLKKQLQDNFKVIGYFKNDLLVGFYTVFFENQEGQNVIESHYLGIDQEENKNCQIYINMLYDMIKMGIYHQVQRIYLARTALEIKSSVGAVPHELYFYMKHNNRLFNPLVKKTFDWFNPKEAWVQRQPFK